MGLVHLTVEELDVTSGIAMPSATYPSGQALTIGTGISTPATFGSNELVEWHGRLNSATAGSPLLRCRASAPASTAMTTGAVISGQFQAYGTDTNNIAVLNAVQGHCGIKAASTIIADLSPLPNMTAGWFKIEDLGFDLTLTGDAAALCLGIQFNSGTTLTGTADWIVLNKEGSLTDPADAFVRVYDGTGGGWANFLFDCPASTPAVVAGGTYSTAEGYFLVKVGANTYRMPFYTAVDA